MDGIDKRLADSIDHRTGWLSQFDQWLEKNIKWCLLAPALVVVLVLGVYPLVYALEVSVSTFQISDLSPGEFVGLANYIKVLKDWHFWNVMRVTGSFVLIVVPTELLLGIVIAAAFDSDHPILPYIRTFLLIPAMIAPVAVAILWRLMYQSEIGVINYILSLIGISKVEWLGDPDVALFSVAIVDIWQWTPFVFLLVLAGFRGLPVDVIEAAEIDGASYLQSMFLVRIPLIKNVILVASILRFLDAVRAYDTIYVMTYGGPASSTDVYSMYTFREAFKWFNLGEAAALSILFLVILSVLVPLIFVKGLGFRIENI